GAGRAAVLGQAAGDSEGRRRSVLRLRGIRAGRGGGKADGEAAYLIALLGGEAGLRCGEIVALEWSDVDLAKHQLSVARSEWKGHVTATQGGRVRHVPTTGRLTEALRQSRSLKARRVVCDGKGTPLSQKEVQVIMRRVGRKASVKPGVHI